MLLASMTAWSSQEVEEVSAAAEVSVSSLWAAEDATEAVA